mgnify:FL=1
MFAYCNNNPANLTDSSGNLPKWFEKGLEWLNNKVDTILKVVEDIRTDMVNFDIDNQSEQKVLESNYFSYYKGCMVFRTNGDRSGSFGALFITRETNFREHPEDMVRHEYGHTLQLKELGVINYTLCIGIPSFFEWGSGEYYGKPWEITADAYGKVLYRNHDTSDIMDGFAYLDTSKKIGPLIWLFIDG